VDYIPAAAGVNTHMASLLLTPPPLRAAFQEAAPIQVPDGFTVEKIAASPLVERPIMACLSTITAASTSATSAGVNLRFEDLLKGPPHRMIRLEDSDGERDFRQERRRRRQAHVSRWAPCGTAGTSTCARPPSGLEAERSRRRGRVPQARGNRPPASARTANAGRHPRALPLPPTGGSTGPTAATAISIDRPDGLRACRAAPRASSAAGRTGRRSRSSAAEAWTTPVEIAFHGGRRTARDPWRAVPVVAQARRRHLPTRSRAASSPYHECVREFQSGRGDLLPSVIDVGWVAPSGLMR